VPANYSLSSDGYYYTPTEEIFGGNKYSTGWLKANGCSRKPRHYPTRFDGGKFEMYCVSEGDCSDGDVVRCAWNGGHNWLFNNAEANGGLVTEFLLRWSKPSHVGAGSVAGGPRRAVTLLQNLTLDQDSEEPNSGLLELVDHNVTTASGRHYGDPDVGCRDDEDSIPAGTGRTCAPRIGVSFVSSDSNAPPTPQCKVGGVMRYPNGCPTDAPVTAHSTAWPVCLAKAPLTKPNQQANTDAYMKGDFHCLLACPCGSDGATCSADSHRQCPRGARCERGDLRHLASGVCTYHGTQ